MTERKWGLSAVSEKREWGRELEGKLSPFGARLDELGNEVLFTLPLLAIGLAVILVAVVFGRWIVQKEHWFRRLIPNGLLRHLFLQTIKVVLVGASLLLCLELVGAGSLVGALLGTAGVIGLAVGFAFKDIVQNYIAGVFLSLRQPFHRGDLIRLDEVEGLVLRMDTRATIIKTLDGNNITIPNATVFQSKIINYSTIPERRFEFRIGIDSEADPDVGREVGVGAMARIEGVLHDPAPFAHTEDVGDSSIVLGFFGWVNQKTHDFFQVRSAAVRGVKDAIEGVGISIPEPIYTVKWEEKRKRMSEEERTVQSEKVRTAVSVPPPSHASGASLETKRQLDDIDELMVRDPEYQKDDLLDS